MKTAAIIIDTWKLPVFERRLKDAGYSYEQLGNFSGRTLTLRVSFKPKDIGALECVVRAAQEECATAREESAAMKGNLQ